MSKLNANLNNSFISIKSGIKEFWNRHKFLVLALSFFVLVALLTGIFTAVKNADNYSSVWFDNYNIIQFYNSEMGTWELFFSRFISYAICLIVIWICSLTIFLTPLSFAMLMIRAYLVGLNSCFMFILFGLSGILTTIIIIAPCQIISLVLLIVFMTIMLKRASNKRKFGSYCVNKEKSSFVIFLIFLLLLTLVNFLETLLLYIFSTKIILVI